MKKKGAYYNEVDPRRADKLRNLMNARLIADGEIDTRSIKDVAPDDVRSFVQCHWFAGVAVWSYALRQAGWPDYKPVWTGSCPCQDYSVIGLKKGNDGERNLWPVWYPLIDACRPSVVIGEQVAGKLIIGPAGRPRRADRVAARKDDGSSDRAWVDVVRSDLDRSHYAFGSLAAPACGYGAPQPRQRLYWVAESRDGDRSQIARAVDYAARRKELRLRGLEAGQGIEAGGRRATRESVMQVESGDLRPGPTNGEWRDVDWLLRADGRWSPVERGVRPMADGVAAGIRDGASLSAVDRAEIIKSYGNALVAPQAKAFIEAILPRHYSAIDIVIAAAKMQGHPFGHLLPYANDEDSSEAA